MIMHPAVLGVCDAVLAHQLWNKNRHPTDPALDEINRSFRGSGEGRSFDWGCHLHQLISIAPGNKPQPFHEDQPWEFEFEGNLEPGAFSVREVENV
jgi:hypothetical protein